MDAGSQLLETIDGIDRDLAADLNEGILRVSRMQEEGVASVEEYLSWAVAGLESGKWQREEEGSLNGWAFVVSKVSSRFPLPSFASSVSFVLRLERLIFFLPLSQSRDHVHSQILPVFVQASEALKSDPSSFDLLLFATQVQVLDSKAGFFLLNTFERLDRTNEEKIELFENAIEDLEVTVRVVSPSFMSAPFASSSSLRLPSP